MTTKTLFRRRLLVAALSLAVSSLAMADGLRLNSAAAGDQIPGALSAAKAVAVAEVSREPVSFAWALDPNDSLELSSRPFVAESREYWMETSAKDLASGVRVNTSSAGAIVRLSPLGQAAKALNALDVVIRKDGASYAKADAMQNVAGNADLKAAGIPFPEGTLAFRLKRDLGAGAFEIAVPGAAQAYVVHVFEPESSLALNVHLDRDTVLHGSELQVVARFIDAGRLAKVERLAGAITSPAGELRDLRFEPQQDGSFLARTTHDGLSGAGPGLWEVHVFGSAGNSAGSILRDAKTAFSSSVAGARLDGSTVVSQAKAGGLGLSFGIEVAHASRYELRGVLYGTAADGALKPFAIAHSAAWLSAGGQRLELDFDAELLAKSGLSAPFAVRDLRLSDQASMGLIERRALALDGIEIVAK